METFPWHPGRNGRRLVFGIGVVVCLLAWQFLPEDQERSLALCALLLPVLCLIEGVTMVDSGRRIIVRRWKLLGFFPLWRKEVPLEDLEAVTLRENSDPWPGDPGYLVLARKDGRLLKIGYFSEKAVRDGVARRAAGRLSQATGLPLADYPEFRDSRPLPRAG